MTALSGPEVIVTFDLKESPKNVRLNSIRQEGAQDNMCGTNTFPVGIWIKIKDFYNSVQASVEGECATGPGCCDHVAIAGTKLVFDFTADTNLANSFYIRTNGEKAMPDEILVRKIWGIKNILLTFHCPGCVWQVWLHSELLHPGPRGGWPQGHSAHLLRPPHIRWCQDRHRHLKSYNKCQNQWPHASWGWYNVM